MRGISDAHARARRSAVRGHRASFFRVDDDSCAPSGRRARDIPRTILSGVWGHFMYTTPSGFGLIISR